MNIVTPIPTTIVFTTANVNTESARRDNVLRETIPQTSGLEQSAAETGLGSESDRVKTAGQPPQPLTYEKLLQGQTQGAADQGNSLDKDNGEDPSAGKENAESRQQEQQEQAEQRKVEDLKTRDREVRAHEQAHATVGGQYAGSPQYEFETGPDGRQYAVGGEVSIDISEEGSPQETIRKMQQVRASALAPADPSPQDLRVASEATQIATEARSDLVREESRQAREAVQRLTGDGEEQASATESIIGPPELDEIVDGIDNGIPTRSLTEDPVAEAVGLETDAQTFRQQLENRDASIMRRVAVIENFYESVATPREERLPRIA